MLAILYLLISHLRNERVFMASLETTYLGLPVKNPVVVASSGLTSEPGQVALCEKAGAGAVVLKCIFEEHLRKDFEADNSEIFYGINHPEAYKYFFSDLGAQYGAVPYCEKIEKASKAVSIPVIAAINCYSSSVWINFAKDLEDAGAHALELNISYSPVTQIMEDPTTHLYELAGAIKEVVKKVSIPVSVKLSPAEFYLGNLAQIFSVTGVKGLILFNRFIMPKINLDKMEIESAPNLSQSSDSAMSFRSIALLGNRVKCELIASGGVHTAEDAIGLICVGAGAVQMASALYKNGLEYIEEVTDGIKAWMDKRHYKSIDDFRGCLAPDPKKRLNPYGRFHYIRMLDDEPPPFKTRP